MNFLKRLISWIRGYKTYTYYVEYDSVNSRFISFPTRGHKWIPLEVLAQEYELSLAALVDILQDTCTVGHIWSRGCSFITLAVKKKKFYVLMSSETNN